MRLPEETPVHQTLVYARQGRKTNTHLDIDYEKTTIKTKYDVGRRSMCESSKQRFIIKTLFIVVCDIMKSYLRKDIYDDDSMHIQPGDVATDTRIKAPRGAVPINNASDAAWKRP